jgi:hypothetical protein
MICIHFSHLTLPVAPRYSREQHVSYSFKSLKTAVKRFKSCLWTTSRKLVTAATLGRLQRICFEIITELFSFPLSNARYNYVIRTVCNYFCFISMPLRILDFPARLQIISYTCSLNPHESQAGFTSQLRKTRLNCQLSSKPVLRCERSYNSTGL